MGSYRRGPPQPQFRLPPLLPWVRNLLVGLIALWIVELVLTYAIGLPVYQTLAWTPGTVWDNPEGVSIVQWGLEAGDLFQPVTHFFIQGPNPIGLALTGLMIYLFAPFLRDRFTPRQQIQLGAAAVGGAIAAGVVWAALCFGLSQAGLSWGDSLIRDAALGLNPIVSAGLAVYALAQLGRMVQMPFGPPFEGKWVFWFLAGLTVVFFLLNPGTETVRSVGAFGAAVAWWYTLGPGGTRRRYKQAGRKVERQVQLRVVQGGRQDDDWVN